MRDDQSYTVVDILGFAFLVGGALTLVISTGVFIVKMIVYALMDRL